MPDRDAGCRGTDAAKGDPATSSCRLAAGTKGHAASLYLLLYYLGSSIMGSAGGWFWQHGGWSAVALLTGGLALLGTLLAATAL